MKWFNICRKMYQLAQFNKNQWRHNQWECASFVPLFLGLIQSVNKHTVQGFTHMLTFIPKYPPGFLTLWRHCDKQLDLWVNGYKIMHMSLGVSLLQVIRTHVIRFWPHFRSRKWPVLETLELKFHFIATGDIVSFCVVRGRTKGIQWVAGFH